MKVNVHLFYIWISNYSKPCLLQTHALGGRERLAGGFKKFNVNTLIIPFC